MQKPNFNNAKLKKLSLIPLQTLNFGDKLKGLSLALNDEAGVLYIAVTSAKTIYQYDLDSQRVFAENLKCSNASIDRILVDQKSKLLYCSTKEGLLLFVDISKKQPVVCHSLKLVKVPETGRNFIKQMDHDILRHLLVLRMKNSDMILVQLNDNFMKAYITENVRFKSFKDD